jgi:5'-nucleotidase
MRIKPCLFDLDGTVADHTGALMRDLAKIQSPTDPPISRHDESEPEWVKERKRLIRSQRNWWFNLEPMPLGFDIYHLARKIGFQINILTKGPWTCDHAWTEKVQWCRKHLHDDVKITISEDKSIVYGRVLVDDYLPYVLGWLMYRPRGLVVMPANSENEDVAKQAQRYSETCFCPERIMEMFHRAVLERRLIRYDGTNMLAVESAMRYAFDRDSA